MQIEYNKIELNKVLHFNMDKSQKHNVDQKRTWEGLCIALYHLSKVFEYKIKI